MISIEIHIKNIGNNLDILIDIIKNKIIINNKEKNITQEQVDNLLRIIRTWNQEYNIKNNLIGSEQFQIIINTNEGTDIINGNGEYPENYIAFKKWIGDFYE